MIRFYNYKPDTCDCFICERYDDTLDQWSYVEEYTVDNPLSDNHDKTFTTSRCSIHAGITDIKELFNAVYGAGDSDQKRKNKTEGYLLQTASLNLSEQVTDNGGTYFRFKNGITYNWSFTGTGKDRVLNISISGATLTTNQKNSIKTALDSLFGTGRVIVS